MVKLYHNMKVNFFSCFYGACDAIFLNYSWKEKQLENSRNYARKLGPFLSKGVTCFTGLKQKNELAPPQELGGTIAQMGGGEEEEGVETRVFVGVDVFGRNFYEGGGMNTYKVCYYARQLIKRKNVITHSN